MKQIAANAFLPKSFNALTKVTDFIKKNPNGCLIAHCRSVKNAAQIKDSISPQQTAQY